MAYSDEVLADSPVLYFKFDEASGTAFADSSGGAHGGSHGAGVVVGQSSLLGDGSGLSARWSQTAGSVSRVPYFSGLNVAALTVEARIRPDAAALSGTHVMVGRYGSSSPSDKAWQFTLEGGRLRVVINRSQSSAQESVVTGSTVLTSGTDFTVAFTYDGATARLYVNGVLDASGAVASMYGPASDLTFGTLDSVLTNTTYFYAGLLDEFSLTGAALPDSRLLQRHQAAADVGPPAGDLVGSAPGVVGDIQAAASVPPVDGDLAGGVPGVGGSFAAVVPDAVGGSLGGQVPPVFGSLAGSSAAAPTLTGGTYANDGYNYGGIASVELDVPIAATPPGVRRVKVRRVHQSLPAPTLVDGRPT